LEEREALATFHPPKMQKGQPAGAGEEEEGKKTDSDDRASLMLLLIVFVLRLRG